MQTKTRIPTLPNKSYFAMNRWFYKMQRAGLLYHPDEPAKNIVDIKTGNPTFAPAECEVLDMLMKEMFEVHGDQVFEVCLKYVHKVMGIKPQ